MFTVTTINFKELESESKPVIIDAYASWCGPCMYMKPIFEKVAQELQQAYVFAELNVDEARDVAIKLGISSVPTFIFMHKGKIINKITGAMSHEEFKQKIEESFNGL